MKHIFQSCTKQISVSCQETSKVEANNLAGDGLIVNQSNISYNYFASSNIIIFHKILIQLKVDSGN